MAKLEESISPDLLPEILIVKDPKGKTKYLTEVETIGQATRYKRVYPRVQSDASSEATSLRSEATLDFTDAQPMGTGNHSRVFRTRLHLPVPLTARSQSGAVYVIAKTSLSDALSHDMLRHEAKFYAKVIPSYMSEDWTGYHFVADTMYDDGDGVLPVVAVVPKFYGFYVPEHWVHRGLVSSIMLIEECGVPVEREELKSN